MASNKKQSNSEAPTDDINRLNFGSESRKILSWEWIKKSWIYILGIIVLAIMVFPYLFMLSQSLAPWNQVNKVFFPSSISIKSYRWIFTGGEFGSAQPWLRALLNSFIVSGISTISQLLVAGLAGYALSILSFRGQNKIRTFLLFQMFYPAIILLVPKFLIIRKLGLYNTIGAMVIPFLVSAWAIFMYSNFFKNIPKEMVEAARIDGASEFQIIWKIMVPLARSITTVIFLFLFMRRWIELMWDLVVVKTPAKQTLNVLLATMFGPYASYPGPLYASSVILTFPVIVLFLIFSGRFIQGIEFTVK